MANKKKTSAAPGEYSGESQTDFAVTKYWRQTVFINGRTCTGLVLKPDYDAFMEGAPEDLDFDYWFSDTDERAERERAAKRKTLTT